MYIRRYSVELCVKFTVFLSYCIWIHHYVSWRHAHMPLVRILHFCVCTYIIYIWLNFDYNAQWIRAGSRLNFETFNEITGTLYPPFKQLYNNLDETVSHLRLCVIIFQCTFTFLRFLTQFNENWMHALRRV